MIRSLINFYVLILIIDVILSYFPQFRYKPIVVQIRRAADFTLAPVRKALPSDLPFDFSPVIVILGLKILVPLVELLW